jgi:hypothetical protein
VDDDDTEVETEDEDEDSDEVVIDWLVLDAELEVVVDSVEADDDDCELALDEVVTSLAVEETLLVEEAKTLAEDEDEEEEEEEAGISFAPEIQLALTAAPTAFFM